MLDFYSFGLILKSRQLNMAHQLNNVMPTLTLPFKVEVVSLEHPINTSIAFAKLSSYEELVFYPCILIVQADI